MPGAGGEVFCQGGNDYDLTGTRIASAKPVAVFGGHECTFVPFDRWACDHLEETIFPLDTWGRDLIVASTEPQAPGEPNVWKVVSGSDGNALEFEPAVHPPVTLDAGQYVEFEHEGGFRVAGTGRVAVAQFMVGEDYAGMFCPPEVGDPAMALAVPFEQFRGVYDFLTPATYTRSMVQIVAPVDSPPILDGKPVPRPEPIGDTGWGFVRVEVPPGAHHVVGALESSSGFGLMVSGLASYTSYLYAGGLDLEKLPLE
jgi:hypothetical protein